MELENNSERNLVKPKVEIVELENLSKRKKIFMGISFCIGKIFYIQVL